jgi:hypothetical protein
MEGKPKLPGLPALVGKTITINTLDGKSATGELIAADTELIGIQNPTGRFIIFAQTVTSFFIPKNDAL